MQALTAVHRAAFLRRRSNTATTTALVSIHNAPELPIPAPETVQPVRMESGWAFEPTHMTLDADLAAIDMDGIAECTTLATAAFIGDHVVERRAPPTSEAKSVPDRAVRVTARRVPVVERAVPSVSAEAVEQSVPVATERPTAQPPRMEPAAVRVDEPQSPTNLPSSARKSVAEVAPSELGRRDGPWAVVAAALERGDLAGADRVLEALSASDDGMTRDAAELTRAQIWIAAGKGESFRHTLMRLSESGHTPLIRRRAKRLAGAAQRPDQLSQS